MFITIVSALVTGIGMILGKYLFRYLSLNYLDKVKMASKLQRKINQDITKIYSLTNSDRVSLFKFANGEHYLSDEPVLKVIREYNYPVVAESISNSTYLLSQFSELVSTLEEKKTLKLFGTEKNLFSTLGKYRQAMVYKLAYQKKYFGFLVIFHNDLSEPKNKKRTEEIVDRISHSLCVLSSLTPFHKLEKLIYQMEEIT